MPATPQYRAFISYSHRDKRAAKRWQHRLETFVIDPNLVGRTTPMGAVPDRLSPICRDEIDFPAGGELTATIRTKLDQSAALLVLASPHAAASPYVGAEILYFRREHPDRPICALVLAGESGHPRRECRPLALRRTLDANGRLTEEPFETLLANPSLWAEGPSRAMAKVVAALTGLEASAVLDRAREHVRREITLHGGPALVLVVLMTLIAGGGWHWVRGQFIQLHNSINLASAEKVEMNQRAHERMGILRQNGVIRRAEARGVSELAIWAYVEGLGAHNLTPETLIRLVENWVLNASRARDLPRDASDGFKAASKDADIAFKFGRLAEASRPLMEELAAEQRRDAEAQDQSRRRQVELLESAIRYDALARNSAGIGTKLGMLAGVERVPTGEPLGRWLTSRANARSEDGTRNGNIVGLVEAVAAYQAALAEFPRDRKPQDWARTQRGLGDALSLLGEREGNAGRQRYAIQALEEVLKIWTRNEAPQEWATTQNSIGNAFLRLGRQGHDKNLLERSIDAYRVALAERPRDRVPMAWAGTQSNLGAALKALGEIEGDTVRLKEAVTAYEAAITVFQEPDPFRWAGTLNNLANVLIVLGGREDSTERIEQAVLASRRALEIRTRESMPLGWAFCQATLSEALALLAERKKERAMLEEALRGMREVADFYRAIGDVRSSESKARRATEMAAALAAWAKP